MHQITTKIECSGNSNGTKSEYRKLLDAALILNTQMPFTKIRVWVSDEGPPKQYEMKVDFVSGQTWRARCTCDNVKDPVIDLGFNVNVFRSSEHGHIRDCRLVLSGILEAHVDLQEILAQVGD